MQQHLRLEIGGRASVPKLSLLVFAKRPEAVGHYLGVDKHIELIVYGAATELGTNVY